MGKRRGVLVTIFVLTALTVVSTTGGCKSPKDTTQSNTQPGAGGSNPSLVTSLPPPPPKSGHPKLDTQLNDLIEAEKLGNAEAFALENRIELIDGRVEVIVYTDPVQAEAAVEAVKRLGTVRHIWETSPNLISAIVPINNLTTLAEEESIKFIAIPAQSVPQTTSAR